LGPTTAIPAFTIGVETISLNGVEMNPRDIGVLSRTAPSNFNGYPSISIPCGFTKAGLPIGLQIQGRPFEEGLIFKAAHAFEKVSSQSLQIPLAV
jgi:aspartyl-tRNA(Asn)/glutamyl-tRNA(Gln) amidotransferase subunit A